MFNQENKTEWIDLYLDHLLPDAERQQFEEQLRLDSNLQVEVEAQKAIRKTLQQQGKKELKATFKKYHSRMLEEERSTEPKLWDINSSEENKRRDIWWAKKYILFIAASFVLLLVASIIWINRDLIFNNDQANIVSNKSFQIPMIEEGGIGYAGANTITDSIAVQVLTDQPYTNHYRFKDTLQIFSPSLKIDNIHLWRMEYNDSLNTYRLIINNKEYSLERGFNKINELKPE